MAHIVLDTRIIETSTGRYMQRLLEELNDRYASQDGHSYTALVPSPYVEKWQTRLPNLTVKAADQKWYTFSEQWSFYWLLRTLKPDLVHFTMPQQPLLWRGPAVTTIHDMTLVHFDNIEPGESSLVYHFKQQVFHILLQKVVRRGRRIIVPTEFVRQDLADTFGRKYIDKIVVTHEAGEIPDVDPEPLQGYENTPFLLFVGNGFPYKNVGRIVDAYKVLKLHYPNLQLLIAGKKDAFHQQLERHTKEQGIEGVHFLGFISDGEKRWAFQHAASFVTASKSEGFCIPVLEAMLEGCPVVSSDASCLPEVVGDAGLLFDPDSTPELVTALEKVLDDNSLRKSMIKSGKKRANEFSWSRMTDETHDAYEQALERI